MFNHQLEAVLSIMALSIFADKRVLSTEITAFVDAADKVKQNVTTDLPITEAKMLLWFELNRERIRDNMQLGSAEFSAWFSSLLRDLSGLQNKKFISEIVRSIAHADGELHISEQALAIMIDRKFKRSA